MTSIEIVKSYIPIAKFIAAIMGPRCEVILHCLDDMEHSIIAIENGHITGREIGGCITNFAFNTLFDGMNAKKDFIANYPGVTPDDKQLRSSTFYIRDSSQHIIGLLCVNVDITQFNIMKTILEDETEIGGHLYLSNASSHVLERFNLSVEDMLESIYQQTLQEFGSQVDPTHMLAKEKKELMASLNEKNMFALKGAVPLVSAKLCISIPTVYRYLQEIKCM